MASKPKIAIIGAGIVGLATAYSMLKAGWRVQIFDRRGVAEEASFGNAAGLAYSEILPLASPGLLRQAPKWLLDPEGPLHIPPRQIAKVVPWMVRFGLQCLPAARQRSTQAQSALMAFARTQSDALWRDAGLAHHVTRNGVLHIYEAESELQSNLADWKARADHRIAFNHLYAEELWEFEPALSKRCQCATFVPGWENVKDPYRFALALSDQVVKIGGEITIANVERVVSNAERPEIKLSDGRTVKADKVVVAAGVWSRQLALQLGDRIPLVAERGYTTTLPVGASALKKQIILGKHGFVVTPLEIGIRIGGASEMTTPDATPNFARSKALLEKAQWYLNDLNPADGVEWVGARASTPDTLPVIDTSAASRDIIYAFGHGHLGLTQAAATATLVCEIASGLKTSIDIAPYSARRPSKKSTSVAPRAVGNFQDQRS